MRQSVSRLGKAAVVVPGIAVALLVSGCGEKHDAGKQGATGPAASSSAKTHLTITVRANESAKAVSRTLTCDPVGGDLPKAQEACATLDKAASAGKDPFAPTPKGQMCTQIYGGPQTATVTGTWNGKPVNATFDRKNGCEIKRWGDLASLFGPLA